MGRKPVSLTTKGMVRTFLGLNYSYSEIRKRMSAVKRPVSNGWISKLKKETEEQVKMINTKKKKHVFKKMSVQKLRMLDYWLRKSNAPSHKWIASRMDVTEGTIRYHIKHSLRLKRRKKTRVHYLSDLNIKNRRQRSLPLYRKLCAGRYKDFVTTDEAWFYLSDFNQENPHEYVKIGVKSRAKSKG